MFMSEGFQGLGQGWMMCHGGHIWSSSTYLARYAAYVISCYSSQGALFGHFSPHSHRLAHIVVTRSL